MFDNDLTEEELKKVLEEYRSKMLIEYKEKEEIKRKIDDYCKKYIKEDTYMDRIQKFYNHDVNSLTSKESNPLKQDMYEKYICSQFGHEPERIYNGAIKEENGMCICRLCGKSYNLEKNTKKSK